MESPAPQALDVLVIGGGITGLTTAYLLAKAGRTVALLEKSSVTGGAIQSKAESGFRYERGPNSLLLPDPWTETLISELDLESQLIEADAAAKKRYIIRGGKPVPVPGSPIQAITSPLFSFRAKLGVLIEPIRPKLGDAQADKESVADFVRRRLGQEFLDYTIDPFVSGVYAGDPNDLILRYAFPLMRGFERDGGSIIRGAMRHMRRRKADGTAYKKRSISFETGLSALPQAMEARIGEVIHRQTAIETIEREGNDWKVLARIGGASRSFVARRIAVCIPSTAARALPWPKALAASLNAAPDLDYPTVHSLALGFRRDQIAHPLDGFGMLAPSRENRAILGALFSSSMFPRRAPEGHVLLTVMIGGRRRPDLGSAEPERLQAIALDELRSLVGLVGEPTFFRITTWPRAIPQYNAAFPGWIRAVKQAERDYPGLEFGGNAVDGIALGACLLSGRRIAEKIASDLANV